MRKFFLSLATAMVGFTAAQSYAADFDTAALAGSIQAPNKSKAAVYVVGLKGRPAIAYEGGEGNLKATKPAKGQKLKANNNDVKRYVAHLKNKQDSVLASVGGSNKIYNYVYSSNGFAAKLNEAQVAQLRNHPDVSNIWKDEMRRPTTDSTPDYLGLRGQGGVWEQYGKGEDIIIGVLDTGAWPEHPSFSDQTGNLQASGKGGKKKNNVYGPPPAHWAGTCQTGEQWSKDDCNDKLIGARYYKDGFSAHGNSQLAITEYQSARDSDGHGSHTASTAGGNEDVANTFGTTSSGVAPRARVAVYKVCWTPRVGLDGCAPSDSMAAIDQAVVDGVDVINFSIGGASNVFGGPDDVAFLFAADAGVHVATSNGNDGPLPETTGTPSGVPWITAVGAAQDNEVFALNLTVDGEPDATDYLAIEGAGDVALTDIISGELIATSPDIEACVALDNDDLDGEIALVRRGGCAFTDKYNNAAAAGAAAIVVYNDGTAADRFDPFVMSAPGTSIPGVMIGNVDGLAIIANGLGAAKLDPANTQSRNDRIADFSSRGSNLGAPDIIKPDVAAPGVGIIAAGSGGGDIQISGTSMASPHVAGLMALLKEAHPDWSPAAMKSALMTTGRQDLLKSFGDEDADPFDIGAGHIVPAAAFSPGLVYDAGLFDYAAFSCENNTQIFSDDSCNILTGYGYPTDASDLNMASIGVAELVGVQTVTRRVTNVTGDSNTFDVVVDAPEGIDVEVLPTSLTLAAGEIAPYIATFSTQASATLNEWTFGSLTWSTDAEGVSDARSPIAIRPVEFDAPASADGAGTDGSTEFEISFGYEGDYNAGIHGIVEAERITGSVIDDPEGDINAALGSGVGITIHTVTLPTAAPLVRFALFDDYTDGNDDLDLYVFDETFANVGGSGSVTSAEQVDVVGNGSTTYYVVVHGWETDGADANYTLFGWAPSADAGNMTVVAPNSATLGETETVNVSWTGLGSDKYMGAVSHNNGSELLGATAITIDTE